jgi:hypothetical protein
MYKRIFQEVADALFLLFTQISLTFKTHIYFLNRHRLKKVVERLDDNSFCPQSVEEDEWEFFYVNF